MPSVAGSRDHCHFEPMRCRCGLAFFLASDQRLVLFFYSSTFLSKSKMNTLLLLENDKINQLVYDALCGAGFGVAEYIGGRCSASFSDDFADVAMIMDSKWLERILGDHQSLPQFYESLGIGQCFFILMAADLSDQQILSAMEVGVDDFIFDQFNGNEWVIRISLAERILAAQSRANEGQPVTAAESVNGMPAGTKFTPRRPMFVKKVSAFNHSNV